jgi:hypothetical protein
MSRTFFSKKIQVLEKITIASADKQKVQDNRAGCRRVGPTCRFTASPNVGLGPTIDILQAEYPYI